MHCYDNGFRRRQWWFSIDPTLKDVFYHGVGSASNWLNNYKLDVGDQNGPKVFCYHVNNQFVGYIELRWTCY